MLTRQDSIFLRRAFSQFLPDVFSHPLWLGFIEEQQPFSPTIVQELMPVAGQLQADGSILGACQVWFLCAALQKKIGDRAGALHSILHVWRLAEIHDLPQVSRWAAWGASALCFSLHDDPQAAKYLEELQKRLSAQGEWMTANLIFVLRSALLHQTEEGPGTQVLLSWLRLWGERNPILETGEAAPEGEKSFLTVPKKAGRHSLWQTFKQIASRSLHLLDSGHANPDHAGIDLQPRSPTAHTPVTGLPAKSASPQPDESLKLAPASNSVTSKFVTFPVEHANQAPSLVVYCLGPLRIYQNSHLIETWSSKKALSIFKYLVTHRDSLAQKDLLMDTFWPDADPESARRNLHQAVYSLRQTFNLGNLEFQYVQFWNDGYRLNPSLNIWVDYEEFEQHVQAGQLLEERKRIESAMAEYGIAEGLYQDDFLTDDPYEEWALAQRRYLLQAYLSTALRLVQYYFECREYAAAIALSRRILSKDSCQEEAHQYLIRCYLEQGQRHLAMSQYQLCVQLLRDELGLSPSAETRNLYRQINTG